MVSLFWEVPLRVWSSEHPRLQGPGTPHALLEIIALRPASYGLPHLMGISSLPPSSNCTHHFIEHYSFPCGICLQTLIFFGCQTVLKGVLSPTDGHRLMKLLPFLNGERCCQKRYLQLVQQLYKGLRTPLSWHMGLT